MYYFNTTNQLLLLLSKVTPHIERMSVTWSPCACPPVPTTHAVREHVLSHPPRSRTIPLAVRAFVVFAWHNVGQASPQPTFFLGLCRIRLYRQVKSHRP